MNALPPSQARLVIVAALAKGYGVEFNVVAED
jgi:hypothetical protein